MKEGVLINPITQSELNQAFNLVKPIIYKLRRTYYIQLWELDDWLQEGRLILYQLLELYPDLILIQNSLKLKIFFKTKFSSYIKDRIRHQESYKCRFNRLPYEEVSDISHRIPDDGLVIDDIVCYRAVLEELKVHLNGDDLNKLDKVLSGQQFSGKKAFLRRLKPYFIDFQ
ncbi:sigma-70 family RNA polymerase sigma factor [Streptococcus bovimastitidis]|uniref:sigma-70 family RNA polymerase sigma factor n=1 Tax=Streptococcus bovimastitidis TaxID=1856638 RepID=UPI000AB14625|nr:sigma-70 family RNA polymerase sigma factor [Streptococcus bovimastitidis]